MLADFFHILNPNRSHRRGVRRFFRKNPRLQNIWIDRDSHPTHLETVVQWALNEGYHEIAVWGGDGTLSRVLQSIYEFDGFEKMTVALIPVGTCNDFARSLGLPPWKSYAKSAINNMGYPRFFDVGLLSSAAGKRIFINNAGFGRSAQAIHGTQRSNPIKDIFSFTPKKLDLEWAKDGVQHFETRAGILGVVCNAPFFNNGMYFDKSVQPDDGVISAFIENPQSSARLLLKFGKSRLGFPLASAATFRVDANALSVESDDDLFPQVDGEPASRSGVRVLRYSVLPKKLRFVSWTAS